MTTEQRLQDLLTYRQEELDREYKSWLDLSQDAQRAVVGKALLALANHGGGYLIIGFEPKSLEPDTTNRPTSLQQFNQDTFNDIVSRYADPSFHCSVQILVNSSDGLEYPIVSVPGGHKVPIRAKRGGPNGQHILCDAYYIRRLGPRSEPPQTSQEWNDLIQRCLFNAKEELLENIRKVMIPSQTISKGELGPTSQVEDWMNYCDKRWSTLVQEKLAGENPSRFRFGFWTIGYVLLSPIRGLTRDELLRVLRQVKGSESGWPPWWVPESPHIAPYTFGDDTIECWLGGGVDEQDVAHSDFWSVCTAGKAFIRSGYIADILPEKMEPGTVFVNSEPVWKLAQCLLHAARFAKELCLSPDDQRIAFSSSWSGLKDRMLAGDLGSNFNLINVSPHYVSRQPVRTDTFQVTSEAILSNLQEVIQEPYRNLLEAFNYFADPALSERYIENQLFHIMRRHR